MRALVGLASLLVLLPLDAPARGRRDGAAPNAPERIMVVDAHGQQVGTVVGAKLTQVTIALGVNGRHVLLHVNSAVDTESFPGTGLLVSPIRTGADAHFESRDCSGPPFLLQSANRLLDWGAVASPGMTLYLPETPGAAPTRITWRSYRDSRGCRTQEPPVVSDAYVPAVAIVDLLILFTPPFRLVFVE